MTYAETAKCYYCGGQPVHRTGPAGWAICKACDDKLDKADKRILIDVQGGLIQDIVVTPGTDVKVFVIDWDNVKEGATDGSAVSWDNWTPGEISLDLFRERLKEAEREAAERQAQNEAYVDEYERSAPVVPPPPTPPVPPPAPKPKFIWVAVIHHKHGNDIFVSATKRGCTIKIYGYVKSSWADHMDDKPVPEDMREAITEYFEYVSDHGIYEYIDYWDRTELTP